MIVKRGFCKLCSAAFTVYGSSGCSVIRLDTTGKRLACRFRDQADTMPTCPALHNAATLLFETPGSDAGKPEGGLVQLSKHDQWVYAALTQEFATSADIALRAKLPSRARAKRAEAICSRLVRYGLAETAQSRTRPLWRLNPTVLGSQHDPSMLTFQSVGEGLG